MKFLKGENRTKNLIVQIKHSTIYKILAILMSFILIRILVNYLGVEYYGIWSLIYTFVMWIVFFDLGLNNGTRNKVAEALSKNDVESAKIYISSSYIAIGLFSIIVFVLLLFFSNFINWQKVINSTSLSNDTIQYTFLILLFFILVNFVLMIINGLFHAVQKSSDVVRTQFLTNLFLLIGITISAYLIKTPNFIVLAFVYGFAMIGANIVMSFIFYHNNSDLLPSMKSFDKNKLKEIVNLGLKFFIIQIAVLIIYSTDKIIVAQLFGPSEVTQYDLIFKIFSVILILHGLIMGPLWSTFTEAYHKQDFMWIRAILFKLNLLMIPVSIFIVIFILSMQQIINLWIGEQVSIDQDLVLFFGLFTFVSVWNGIYANFVNGINQIKPQLITAIIGAIINIPLSIYFAKYLFHGIEGVIFASFISLSFFAIVGPIQTYSTLRKALDVK